RQPLAHSGDSTAAGRRCLLECLQLLDTDKRAYFGHVRIDARLVAVAVGDLAKIADRLGPVKYLRVMGAEAAAFHRREGFGGMKAEHLGVAKASDQMASDSGAE